jgi:hypothetical protein
MEPRLSFSRLRLGPIYLASADASIACWNAKYTFNFWRKITAIQNGDADGNDRTQGDPAWTSLFPTPQHPEYLSGHATKQQHDGDAVAGSDWRRIHCLE